MVRVIEGKYLSPVLQRHGLTCYTSERKINEGNSHCSGCEWKMCRIEDGDFSRTDAEGVLFRAGNNQIKSN